MLCATAGTLLLLLGQRDKIIDINKTYHYSDKNCTRCYLVEKVKELVLRIYNAKQNPYDRKYT